MNIDPFRFRSLSLFDDCLHKLHGDNLLPDAPDVMQVRSRVHYILDFIEKSNFNFSI